MSGALRRLAWRLGRKLYTYARDEGGNDPRTNGEYWLLEQVVTTLPGPLVLLDVGANKGEWTAHALETGRRMRAETIRAVHAFEPSSATRAMLSERFGGAPAVTVEPYALSDRRGEAVFYSDTAGSGTNSLSPISGRNAEAVQVSTIDDFLRDAHIERVAMLKIDTEGFDSLVLRGAAGALAAGRIEVVQFEYNWRWLVNSACLRDVFELIRGSPYRLGSLSAGRIDFYDAWHFELDRFFEKNYVLVRGDSALARLGRRVRFDGSNVAAPEK